MRIHIKRAVALLIVISLLTVSLSACGENNSSEMAEPDTKKITDIVTQAVTQMLTPTPDISFANDENVYLSWKDYIGNGEAFVYGLLFNELSLIYNVFPAYIDLGNGKEIFGMAYTDYTDMAKSEDETISFFPAGFLSFIGEEPIPKELRDGGIEIHDYEYEDEKCRFVLAYDTDECLRHCIVWGSYIKYGVTREGEIFYESEPYQLEKIDYSLGALYSYDEGCYIYDPEFDTRAPINATSLVSIMDFKEIEAEIQRILDEQDELFSEVNVQTLLAYSKENVTAALLSKQEEYFMGISVKELKALSEQIDPNQFIKITKDGVFIDEFQPYPPKEPEPLVKWLVGIGTVVTFVSSLVLTILVPPALPLLSAISGASMEVFMEVIIGNRAYEDINWTRVGISAAAAVAFAWLCPQLASGASKLAIKLIGKGTDTALLALGKLAGYGVLTLSSSIVSGMTSVFMEMAEGKSWDEAQKTFVSSALIGAGFTVGISIAIKIIGATVISPIGKGIKTFIDKHPNNWFASLINKGKNAISNIKVVHLENKKLEDILVPKSIHEASKQAVIDLRTQECKSQDLTKRILNLPSNKNKNFVYYDEAGNVIKKEDLYKLNGNGKLKISDICDEDLAKVFKEKGVTELKINKGAIDFSPVSEYEFVYNISPNRSINMNEYQKYLANEWSLDNSKIPNDIKKAFIQKGLKLDNINSVDVADVLSDLHLTLHEDVNNTVKIVDSFIHSKISHSGGVSLAKTIEEISAMSELFKNNPDGVFGFVPASSW